MEQQAMTTIIADIQKEIIFDRATRDFSMYISIDGKREYIGSASTYGEGEMMTNEYVFNFLMDSNTIETAAELLMQEV
jgi:hypothetical protein